MRIDLKNDDLADLFYRTKDTSLTAGQQFALNALRSWEAEGLFLEIKTSGSTGDPTTIQLDKELILWSVNASEQARGIDNDTKQIILIAIPVNKTGGAMQLARAFKNKSIVEIVEPSGDPMKGIESEHDFTDVSLTPFQVGRILEDPESVQKLSRFERVLIGGGSISEKTKTSLLNAKINALVTYGMTETAGHVALQRLDQDLFYPVSGVELAEGADGRLVISIGELGRKFETNDIVEFESNGNGFKIHGRLDHVINSGGSKLNPVQMEDAVRKAMDLPFEYFFFGEPDPSLGERCVLVTDRPIEAADFAAIRSSLSSEQKPHAHYTANFVYTNTGKLQREKTFANRIDPR